MPDALDLTPTQARVLGALLEKELTTPDTYPLTLNALVTACNQTSNRDPIVHYEPFTAETAVLALKSKGLARVVHPGSGERATKYRQVAHETLGLGPAERAILGILLLRGAQTAAELRARTERLHGFASAADVDATLDELARRTPALVMRVGRRPGQKEERWAHLLGGDLGAGAQAAVEHTPSPAPPAESAGGPADELERRLTELEARVAALEARHY